MAANEVRSRTAVITQPFICNGITKTKLDRATNCTDCYAACIYLYNGMRTVLGFIPIRLLDI